MVAEESLSDEVGRSERQSATNTQHLASSVGREGLPPGAILQRRTVLVVEMRRLTSLQTDSNKQAGMIVSLASVSELVKTELVEKDNLSTGMFGG
jgi:hypothetical protein